MEIDGGETAAANACWWWGGASSLQIAAGVASVRRGYGGSGASMPFRAFLVASLFVGAGTTAAVGVLQANGLRNLEDWKRLGEDIRKSLPAPIPRGRISAAEVAGTSAAPSSDALTAPADRTDVDTLEFAYREVS